MSIIAAHIATLAVHRMVNNLNNILHSEPLPEPKRAGVKRDQKRRAVQRKFVEPMIKAAKAADKEAGGPVSRQVRRRMERQRKASKTSAEKRYAMRENEKGGAAAV